MDLFWSLPIGADSAGLATVVDGLFASAHTRHYVAGAMVADSESAPRRSFRCVSGAIKVTKLLPSGREVFITILQAGSIWSDRAVLNGYWRTVFLEAIEPCEIASVTAAAFESALASSPELLPAFMSQISEQISEALTLFEDFRGRDVAPRLARILVSFSNRYGEPTQRGVRINFPVTHQDLANMIGTARETVSRNMALFRQLGYVKEGNAATLEIIELRQLEKLIV